MSVSDTGPLPAKLQRKQIPDDLTVPPRLLILLDESLNRPLTLVCAPPGFGKSTLISAWAKTRARPAVWITLDDADSALPVFLASLLQGLRSLVPGVCTHTLDLLRGDSLPPLAYIVGTLINELEELPDQVVVVLDDYHLVGGDAVPGLVASMLRRPPATLHLVLACRAEPRLPVAALRGRGAVAELRARELRLTAAEAMVSLERMLEPGLARRVGQTLVEEIEGWPVGLTMGVRALREGLKVDELPAYFGLEQGSPSPVDQYLRKEVFDRQPAAIQDFLQKIALPDRFCVALCEALQEAGAASQSGKPAARQLFDQIRSANLFLTPLDDTGEWYRFDRLFRRALNAWLKASCDLDEIAALHRAAGAWFDRAGKVEEAVYHALNCGDVEIAVRRVEQNRLAALNGEQWRHLERWLGQLPPEVLTGRAELSLAQAWLLQSQYRLAEVHEFLARLTDDEPGLPLSLQGEAESLRCQLAYLQGDMAEAAAAGERSLAALPPDRTYALGTARLYRGLALHALGNPKLAGATLFPNLSDQHGGDSAATRQLIGLAINSWMAGEAVRIRQTLTQLRDQARSRELRESLGWSQYLWALYEYERNQVAPAEEHLTGLWDRRREMHFLVALQAGYLAALCRQVRGGPAEAAALGAGLVAFAQETGSPELLAEAHMMLTRLAVLRGDLREAAAWAAGFAPGGPYRPMFLIHDPHLSLAYLLVAQGTGRSLRAAARLLEDLVAFALATRNARQLAELRLLQALMHLQGNQPHAAEHMLAEALKPAETGQCLRPFLDVGPKLENLLRQAATQLPDQPALARLLAAQPPAGPRRDLIEPLTDRELAVLRLLAERFSNAEIARLLGISLATVKKHTTNIYLKLHVNSRRDAVEPAREMHVLPPK